MIKKFGYFTPQMPTISGIRYGNWGSRPFEYKWAADVESVEGLRVLDCGTGLPSEHTWHQFVRQVLKPSSYVGIDLDTRLKGEEINLPDHKMLYMDMTDLKFPDKSFDACYSISTFEHIPKTEMFFKAMSEIHRVMVPGGKLIVTLDEFWDIGMPCHGCGSNGPWNDLERDLRITGNVTRTSESFSMEDFAKLIKPLFSPVGDEMPVSKTNADSKLLYSHEWNCAASYGVFTRNEDE